MHGNTRFDRQRLEAGFFWAENRGGWDTMYVGRDAFFDEFSALVEDE